MFGCAHGAEKSLPQADGLSIDEFVSRRRLWAERLLTNTLLKT
jgi:hypothetical protein